MMENRRISFSADDIEDRLASVLKPVFPRKDFIDQLQSQLKQQPVIFLERTRTQGLWIILVSGLMVGLFVYMLSKGIKS